MPALPCREMTATTALHKLKRKIPYGWDLNIYRGCAHGCQYCYAMYSHGYLSDEDFFGSIYAKTNIAQVLERELSAPGWKREIVNLGGVTDSYQPAEAHFRLMPDILKLMIKYRTPVIISSKSDLILRDYDLIDELSRITLVNIAQTITTTDEEIRRKIEPGSSCTRSRFRVLSEFRKTNASIGVHVMPIIPHITDREENLESIFQKAKACGADYLLTGTLYLRGKTRQSFFEFVWKEFPQAYEQLLSLYRTGGADKGYKDGLYRTVNRLREKYQLTGSYTRPLKERLK